MLPVKALRDFATAFASPVEVEGRPGPGTRADQPFGGKRALTTHDNRRELFFGKDLKNARIGFRREAAHL
jgi:hypothetical protein